VCVLHQHAHHLPRHAGADGSVNAWAVQPQHLEPAHAPEAGASAQAAARWAAVVDDASLVSELRDYFDYAQVRIQGEDYSGPRRLSGEWAGGLAVTLGAGTQQAER
jgi:hypothetical protein